MNAKIRIPFATEVKNELTQRLGLYEEENTRRCRHAEIVALLRTGGTLSFKNDKQFTLSFANNNAAVTRRMFALLRAEDAELPLRTAVLRANRLRKRNSYVVTANAGAATDALLAKLNLLQKGRLNIGGDNALTRRDDARQAYLTGAFLGGGSVNRPEKKNHLELKTGNLAAAELILDILLKFGFPAGLYERRDEFVAYVKEGESIIELLEMFGAVDCAAKFETGTNLKAVRMQVNRLVNLETANMNRAVDAAAKTVRAAKILRIDPRFNELPPYLKKTVLIRIENPEASLAELAQMLFISKSGLNGRLKKIADLVEK